MKNSSQKNQVKYFRKPKTSDSKEIQVETGIRLKYKIPGQENSDLKIQVVNNLVKKIQKALKFRVKHI